MEEHKLYYLVNLCIKLKSIASPMWKIGIDY